MMECSTIVVTLISCLELYGVLLMPELKTIYIHSVSHAVAVYLVHPLPLSQHTLSFLLTQRVQRSQIYSLY